MAVSEVPFHEGLAPAPVTCAELTSMLWPKARVSVSVKDVSIDARVRHRDVVDDGPGAIGILRVGRHGLRHHRLRGLTMVTGSAWQPELTVVLSVSPL